MIRLVLYAIVIAEFCVISCREEQTKKQVPREFMAKIRSATFSAPDGAWLVTNSGEFLLYDVIGMRWERIPEIRLNQICFIDSQRGWGINRQGDVQRSVDGGRTWKALARLDYSDAPLSEIKFIDDLHGWLIDPFSLWCTTDGGLSWQRRIPFDNPDQVHEPIRSYCFLTPHLGWLGAEQGAIYRTTDGGKTWRGKKSVAEGGDVFSLFFVDDATGWLCTSRGLIYRSGDGGNNWEPQEVPLRNAKLDSIYFINRLEGWAVGNDRDAAYSNNIWGVILHTTDGGNTWIHDEPTGRELFYHRILFTDAKNGWLLARDNVYRTTNTGKTWIPILEPTAGSVR